MPLLDFFRRQESCRLLAEDESGLKARFEKFRSFLHANRSSLAAMATLEQLYHSGVPVGTPRILRDAEQVYAKVHELVAILNTLGHDRYTALISRIGAIMDEIRGCAIFTPHLHPTIRPLSDLGPDDGAFVGNKAANLGLMGSVLGLRVPEGFAISSSGFTRFIEENGLRAGLNALLAECSPEDASGNEAICTRMQNLVLDAPIPAALAQEILDAYAALELRTRPGVRVAMRSSAVGEDSTASFAGQYATELNVVASGILDAYRKVLASKYSPRAITYRLRYGLDDEDVPMCVACIEMIDSRESGVLYTVDPEAPHSVRMRLAAVAGLGELLVSGQVNPATVLMSRDSLAIEMTENGSATMRMANLRDGGTELVALENDTVLPPDEKDCRELGEAGLVVENHFGGPQDIEWARDQEGRLFILQARPLGIQTGPDEAPAPLDLDEFTVLVRGGVTASHGIGHGATHPAVPGGDIPQGCILVARTASPDLAAFMDRVAGIVTESGSVASHLASVARECGVPMIVGCPQATTLLRGGQIVTLVADACAVVDGIPEALLEREHRKPDRVFDSPVSIRFRSILDRISPLHLTDPFAENFSMSGCRTLHDAIRFAHEQIMRVMFGMAGAANADTPTIRMEFNIPLRFFFIDLGDGLRFGLTDCQTMLPEDIRSVPMRAFWKGLAHPGISWSGAVGMTLGNISSVVMGGMMASGNPPGGDSYALVARDYMNLSAKFGYHFANVDALCTDDAEQNHALIQFSGGVGGYAGKSLRLTFLGTVMTRLGYLVTITGDQLEARVTGLDTEQMTRLLDQTGRLLAASRLLDVGISGQGMVDRLTTSFFEEDYDFLGVTTSAALPGFYVPLGDWEQTTENGQPVILQDGSNWTGRFGIAATRFISKLARKNFQDFLDGLEAYFHFPLAIAKHSEMGNGTARVRVKPDSGEIDAAAGLAFGLQNVGNYYVWRVNALEHNAILFQFVNDKRIKRAEISCPIELGNWVELWVEMNGEKITAGVGSLVRLEYTAPGPVEGHLGLWTKADSRSFFQGLNATSATGEQRFF